jgi:hypothetical protein
VTMGSVLHFPCSYMQGKMYVSDKLQFLRIEENCKRKIDHGKCSVFSGLLRQSYTFPKL